MGVSPLSRLGVLIVDDNIQMINIVKTILRGFGVSKFVEARDAADAFDRVRSDPVDIVIVDYLMEILDGVDFVRLIRTSDDSPNPFIPIIMLTAHSERSRVEIARDAGVTEFCCKPVTAIDLYRKVAACIERPRPFIETPEYFGPCRRRRASDYDPAKDRRGAGSTDAASEDEAALMIDSTGGDGG